MIRRVGREDKEIFCALVDEFYHTDAVLHSIPIEFIEATFNEMMQSDIYLEGYIFEHEDRTAGYATVAKSFSTEAGGLVLWLEEVYIRPDFQGMGIGKEFFDYIESNHDPKHLRLEVEHSNERAIKLYKKLGYESLTYHQMIKEF
ncbi:MAG: GNAT family N-acetyltransferase [Peptostreptococcaceae bacterium]|nr:GNAT family N-acetyltransferase [Peptostreptococcaceae bacterium]